MAAPTPAEVAALQAALDAADAAVTRQGDAVRALKAAAKEGSAAKTDVDAAIKQLSELKLEREAKNKALQAATGGSSADKEAFRASVANALERRLFYLPSFKIYGAVAGLYDYGPPGCAVKQNVTQLWRAHFVLEEGMLELECPAVTPEVVLKASGHVDRFTDLMVADAVTGDCHRADHLLEAALTAALEDSGPNKLSDHHREEARTLLATVEELTADGLGDALDRYGVKAPDTGNPLSRPYAFNLMFKTSIGPRGDQVGYLRPETAQGIFVNFRDLLYYNGGRLPFAAAQIGQSYRNEISPKAGLLRVREFTQAEVEHFCKPDDKAHPKFASVAGVAPLLFSRELQMGADKVALPMTLGDAVARGIIANETLAYFIGRTHLFLTRVGVDPGRLRFRQHLTHEMAHYAEDCWDAEVLCSYGWIECVGLADRSAYDLTAHATTSKTDLSVFEKFEKTQTVDALVAVPNRRALGIAFKKDAAAVLAALAALDDAGAEALQAGLASGAAPLALADGAAVTVTPDHVTVERQTKKITGRSIVPSVIEPSFGLGRIIYCMFEHVFYTRGGGDAARSVFRFAPAVAPVKVTIFPLLSRPEMDAAARGVEASLRAAGLATLLDTTAVTIGKRYARTDEIGVPFGVTVDGQTAADGTVTLRERDSMAQVRVPAAELPALVKGLVDGGRTWGEVAEAYPAQAVKEEEDK